MAKPAKNAERDKERARNRVIATNRRARRDFSVLDTVEAGIMLQGSEVKSLRDAHVQFGDANGWIRNGEMWLLALHIAPWGTASGIFGHIPDRERKLLLHKDEILRLKSRADQEHLALIPLSLYFKEGRVKVEMALAKGKNLHDRRQDIAKRDAELETRRAMARSRRGE
jgi:SsrA-binding protein